MNTPIPFPKQFCTGAFKSGHIQGIAVDPVKGFVYCSYTQLLVKLDLQGNIVGTCEGLTGHLGCIDFNDEDGKVYGSLEYKNDSIGKGIRAFLGDTETEVETAFFIAVFDVDKIDRLHMDACTDGVMKTVWLKEVVEDFNATGEGGAPHRYGCSGIDGTGFGPKFGQSDGKNYLTVAYGIYGDVNRTDNDRQVLLQYDVSQWEPLLKPLSQTAFHKSGPEKPDGKYFLFTGNTTWGVQNLEYDAGEKEWLLCVYRGKKSQYPNYPMYVINAEAPVAVNCAGEAELSLSEQGLLHSPSGSADEPTPAERKESTPLETGGITSPILQKRRTDATQRCSTSSNGKSFLQRNNKHPSVTATATEGISFLKISLAGAISSVTAAEHAVPLSLTKGRHAKRVVHLLLVVREKF